MDCSSGFYQGMPCCEFSLLNIKVPYIRCWLFYEMAVTEVRKALLVLFKN